MVCPSCRMAAVAATEEMVFLPVGGAMTEVTGRHASMVLHAGCKGGTWCDCQHKSRPAARG